MNDLDNSSIKKAETFNLEAYAARSLNYYERLVDRAGLPYFNVFWTDPAEAAHDWPDFGDVMARQLQGAIMLRRMTGRTASTEAVWRRKLLSYVNPADGLMYRPATSFSKHEADWGDAALTLYALVTAFMDEGDSELKGVIGKMVASLLARVRAGDLPGAWFRGFIVKSLMACERHVESGAAIELCRIIITTTFGEDRTFPPDNRFTGHMHAGLRALVGAADYALYTGDAELYSRVGAIYRDVRTFATRFGFLPEQVWRKGDVVACETCALMDYAGLGVTLANHGHPEFWGDMERLMRNHLVESQVTDTSWLRSDDSRQDTEQFSWRDIGPRMAGAWSGWSSPNHTLAYRENLIWGGPELRGKSRALQNCCGGSGVHGLFILWKNAARFEDGCLSANLHLDKLLPQAEIRCLQPYRGTLTVTLREACTVRVRIPEFAKAEELRLAVNGQTQPVNTFGNYLDVGHCERGDAVEIQYPLPVKTEECVIGNPGFRQYRYQVTWKGDTVMAVEPVGNKEATGYSDFDQKPVPVFYGEDGPGPLYQRSGLPADRTPALAHIHEDSGALDLWRFPPSRT